MNTTKIAALYPSFLDAFHHLPTGRSLAEMMNTVLVAQQLQASPIRHWVSLRDQDNPVKRFNELGLPTDEYLRELVPKRVFAWLIQQQPTVPTYGDDVDGMRARYEAYLVSQRGWEVRAHAMLPPVTGKPGQVVQVESCSVAYHVWADSEQHLAPVLRGLRALRAKRHKQVRRLLAQLWAYHQQRMRCSQQEAVGVAETPFSAPEQEIAQAA